MALHACINNVTVAELVDINSETEYASYAAKYSTVLDISDYVVQPQVGWVLQGIVLVAPQNQMPDLTTLVSSRIKYYQSQAPDLLIDLYTQNTLSGITVTQSSQMFSDYQDVLIALREGAWPTAIYNLQNKTPSGFVTQQLIDDWIALIQSKMI